MYFAPAFTSDDVKGRTMIPFHTGMRVTGPDFCGRKREVADLRAYLRSAGRVYLVGERRIGKTSLIFESLRTVRGFRVVYVDLMAVKSVADIVQRFAAAVIKSERRQNKVMALLKRLAPFQPTLTIDPITSAPSIGFSPTSGQRVESLDSVFAFFEDWDKTIVVFDEFQDILDVPAENEVLARLRACVQHLDRISFIFCGSIRHGMEAIFTQHDSPFFNAAMRMLVGPLNRKDFRDFLEQKFRSGDRLVEIELLDEIIEACGDNPGAVQHFCTALWQSTAQGEEITVQRLQEAWLRLFAMQSEQYGIVMQGLSSQQVEALCALADFGGESNLSREFVTRTGIGLQSSVKKALQGLVAKRVATKTEGGYRICDPFLVKWLVSKYR